MACSDCRYYDSGVCRRYPPNYHYVGNEVVTVALPVNGSSPECGEYKGSD